MSEVNLIQSRILYRNASCVVINKLKGEAVEGDKKTRPSGVDDKNKNVPAHKKSITIDNGRGITYLNKELAILLGEEAALVEPVHRLDVPVTGCVLFALNKKALAFLNSAFYSEGGCSSVEKLYWAVLEKPKSAKLISTLSYSPLPESQPGVKREGCPLENGELLTKGELLTEGKLVHWIESSSGKNKSFAYDSEAPGRKKASLYYRITGEGRNYLFAEIRLLSGRHHQIRAQLAAVGLRIKGDLKYGAKRSEKSGGIRLHARSLSFPNPLNKDETIHLTADPPEMDNLWEQFKVKN